MQHMPGPWTVLPGIPDGGGIAIGPMLDTIGPHAMVTFNGGESEANARLIALAPELADLARRVADHFDSTDAPLGRDARALLARL